MEEDKVGVLLVGDDAAVTGLARAILVHERWRVEVAGSLEEAFEKIRTGGFRPHVAVVDLCLPDGLRTELAHDLRQARPRSRIIYITGDPVWLRRLSGPDHSVLAKPFTPLQLVTAVRAALDKMRPVAVMVESDPVFRRFIISALERERLEFVAAPSLDTALVLARQLEAAALFVPEPEDADAFERLLELRRTRSEIAVVALETRRSGFKAAWYDCKLVRPYSARAVAAAVRLVLKRGAYT